jgi:hypothetical protein
LSDYLDEIKENCEESQAYDNKLIYVNGSSNLELINTGYIIAKSLCCHLPIFVIEVESEIKSTLDVLTSELNKQAKIIIEIINKDMIEVVKQSKINNSIIILHDIN